MGWRDKASSMLGKAKKKAGTAIGTGKKAAHSVGGTSTNRLRSKLTVERAAKRATIKGKLAVDKAKRKVPAAAKSATAAADSVKRKTGYGATSIAPKSSKRPKARGYTGPLSGKRKAASDANIKTKMHRAGDKQRAAKKGG